MTRLPSLLVLTDRRAAAGRGRTLAETVSAACKSGGVGIVFREKDLAVPERRRLGSEVAAAVPPESALLVASDSRLAVELGAAGVHLAAADPWPVPTPAVVGRSCHDRAELRIAASEGVDYVTVSPVYATASKPGYGPALGTKGLCELAASSEIPDVYALGGVDSARVEQCLAAGAAGVAVMGAVMAAEDPAAAVTALLDALDAIPHVKEVRG